MAMTALVLWEALAWLLAVIRHDSGLTYAERDWALTYNLMVMLLQVALGSLTRVCLGRSRLGSFAEITWMTALVVVVGMPPGFVLAKFLVPRPAVRLWWCRR